MMNIFNKEMKLFSNPMNLLFLTFVAMLFIPSYPYYVYFFYCILGIFFSFLFGRENKDLIYMTTLPIPKKDIVKGKYIFLYTYEMISVILSIPVIALRCTVVNYTNQAGIEANIALLGFNFIIMAVFNTMFLGSYFKKPEKVGTAFIIGTIVLFLLMIVAEASTFISKAMTGNCFWDSTAASDLIKQIPILMIGILFYIIVALLSYRRDVRHFEEVNIG